MFSINFSNPYIDLAEVDRIIDLADEVKEFRYFINNIKDSRILFAREQYDRDAIIFWNNFRNVIIQRYSKINRNELNLAGRILSELFKKVNWILPKEYIFFDGKVEPLIYSSYSKKKKGSYKFTYRGMDKATPISIINLPAEELDCFWHWSILGHETGHYLWIAIKNLKLNITEKIKTVFSGRIRNNGFDKKMKYIESWCNEFFADVFAVLSFDAAAILTSMHFCYKETYYTNTEVKLHPPIKYRILLQLYILKWLETRHIPGRARESCVLHEPLLKKWKIITTSYKDKDDFDSGMERLLGGGDEKEFERIIEEIAGQVITCLESLPIKTDHLFAGCSDQVFAMINEIIPLLLDFDAVKWDDFLMNYFNNNGSQNLDDFNEIHLITAAAFAFELDHTKYKEIQNNVLYRMRLPKAIDRSGKNEKPRLVFNNVESAIFNGLDDNCSAEKIMENFREIQCECFINNFIPTDETRKVVELAQNTLGFNKGYSGEIDNIQTDYLEKLSGLILKTWEIIKKRKIEKKNNKESWIADEINELFKPTLNLISRWRYYRETVLQNYAGINKPEIGKIYLFFKNLIRIVNFKKEDLSIDSTYLIRICIEDPDSFINMTEDSGIQGADIFHKDSAIINFPYSEMQNVWHWGIIAYQVAHLFYRFIPEYSHAINQSLIPDNKQSGWKKNLQDLFSVTAGKAQANIFALKALGPSYFSCFLSCFLHLVHIDYFSDKVYTEEKYFEIKCQLFFTLYACKKLYTDWEDFSLYEEQLSNLNDKFDENFIRNLNLWQGVDFVNKGNDQEAQLIAISDHIDDIIIGSQDYKNKLKNIINNKDLNLFNKIYFSRRTLLKENPDINFNPSELKEYFKELAENITEAILETTFPSEENRKFKDLISFNEIDKNYAEEIRDKFLLPVPTPIHDKKYNTCHFLAGAIMAFDKVVNESNEIKTIHHITDQDNSEEIYEEINNLMPDIKKIEQSEKIKSLLRDKENHPRLIAALKQIMDKLETIRTAFYHSSLDVKIDTD